MDITDIRYRNLSNPTFNFKELNAILDYLKNLPKSRRFIQSSFGTSIEDADIDEEYIELKFDVDVDSNSVFGVKPGARVFSPAMATCDADVAFDEDLIPNGKGQIYATNGGQAVKNGTVFRCHILGYHRPHLVRYTGADPSVGDRMKYSNGTTFLEKDAYGIFLVCSKPLTLRQMVWVVRVDPINLNGVDCNTISFRINNVDQNTRLALVNIESKPPGCPDVPDTYLDGTITYVCDPQGCWFNETPEKLQQRRGWAKYMMPVAPTVCQPDPEYFVPEWQVFALCDSTPSCNIPQ